MTTEEMRTRIFAAKKKARSDRAAESLEEKLTILDRMREMAETARASRKS